MNIKVASRVRPFSQRELDHKFQRCIDMLGNSTQITDPQDPSKIKYFTYDHSFWSHDSFIKTQNGYLAPHNDRYVDQKLIFQHIGQQAVSSAFQGYHCCVLAYGQTGAGKTYTMVGSQSNKGIIPRACEQIFKRIQLNEDSDKHFEVHLSMLEIYNERIQDLLLHPLENRPKQGLRIKQTQQLGIYVKDLSKHPVKTYEEIEKIMQYGYRNRSIAQTHMSALSSRAHTIITIQLRQKYTLQNVNQEKFSVIHFVDLAGSQKIGKTGPFGAGENRLKEAAMIGKSLSVLGLVICTLADKSQGKAKKSIVPYRDSCLTRILQNSLGGNSKTFMICVVSPASNNYHQSLSTLRYADQAKKIRNTPVVNSAQNQNLLQNLNFEKEQMCKSVQKIEQKNERILEIEQITNIKLKQESKSNLDFEDKTELSENQTHRKLIGISIISTKTLVYMFDNPVQLAIKNEKEIFGKLVVNLIPTDKEGVINLSDLIDKDEDCEPEEILGKDFYFNVIIEQVQVPDIYESVYVEYKVKNEKFETQIFRSPQTKTSNGNPKFNYVKLHRFTNMTPQLLKYLTNQKIIFSVYAFERVVSQQDLTKLENNQKLNLFKPQQSNQNLGGQENALNSQTKEEMIE